ncbi:DUF1752-domain-containing protein [Aureobasidium pullulans]|uniref:DUF1752-domain-containing protein n=1 Tax=Aureobasidium pullulans TaxID=5580 RepID=A0AB74JYM4_AURPU|nr:DUF1752-domain-containing protein [Aureobasidium pullulans]THX64293.1 DUF1752-domain-containing protein [Aureobasidium pullulans]
MPFRPQHSLVMIDVDKMHTIDTRSVEDLFGMWSVFNKISDAMEDGKRLENLSWRLWNRETFVCSRMPRARKNIPLPALSSSVSSSDESDEEDVSSLLPSRMVRPELRRSESSEHRNRGRQQNHITPIDLEKMVISIKAKKSLEPLSALSMPSPALPSPPPSDDHQTPTATKPTPSAPAPALLPERTVATPIPTIAAPSHLESSTSTVSSTDSQAIASSSESSSTEMSTHNIVRGFRPEVPSSYRSQTNLAATQPTPILKTSPQYHPSRLNRPKKGATFTLGASSGEEESSLDSHMGHNSVGSLSTGLPHPPKKHASFRDIIQDRAITDSPVFEESDDEDDDDAFESVIEEDEDSSDWEDDEVGESGNSSADENKSMFRRVDSQPNLTSRRSMLTTMMHEPDRARAMANAASRSTPALRRSRAASPNGPSATPSPHRRDVERAGPDFTSHPSQLSQQAQDVSEASQPRPIIMTTSNTHQPALSPRTTRRNMLSTELTESLRKNLLWERQHKSSNNLAAMKRRHTSHDIKNLKQHPEPQMVMSVKENDKKKFSNEYFNQGLQEYHAKGW